jgi:F-type H+-transporting ATPase subunit alpha
MVELLKQGQAVPMAVENQILIIYAGTSGNLDGVDLSQIADYEVKLLAHMRETHPEVLESIREKLEIDDEMKKVLERTVGQFTQAYLGGEAPDPRAHIEEKEEKEE